MLSDRCPVMSCLSVCLSVLSVCDVGVLWPNGWMDQDGTWHVGRPWPGPHCATWRPSSPSSKMGYISPPQFSAHVYCVQTAGCIRKPLGTEVGLGPGDIVRWGPSSPEKGYSPRFSVDVYCGQTAWWIKMPLDMKVGLGPCHIVLDGDLPPPPERDTRAPCFRPVSIVATVAHLSYCYSYCLKFQLLHIRSSCAY